MSHKSEKIRKMSQHKAKSAEARPACRRLVALPPLELPPLFCPWGAAINFKHRRAALSVIRRGLLASEQVEGSPSIIAILSFQTLRFQVSKNSKLLRILNNARSWARLGELFAGRSRYPPSRYPFGRPCSYQWAVVEPTLATCVTN